MQLKIIEIFIRLKINLLLNKKFKSILKKIFYFSKIFIKTKNNFNNSFLRN